LLVIGKPSDRSVNDTQAGDRPAAAAQKTDARNVRLTAAQPLGNWLFVPWSRLAIGVRDRRRGPNIVPQPTQGFSLEEIAEQLAILPDIHPVPPKVWEPLRKKWEQRIDQNIAELKQLKIDLKRCARDASRWAHRSWLTIVVSTSAIGETAENGNAFCLRACRAGAPSDAGLSGRQTDLLFVLPFQLPMVLREQSGRPWCSVRCVTFSMIKAE
jgi:hypothetical protein